MKLRRAAALALVGWYLMVIPTTTNAQASPTSIPSKKAAHVWPTVSQAQAEADYPQLWKAQQRAEAAIVANAWVLKVPHVKYMTPDVLAIQKGVGETGIGVFVDKSENVREVLGKVPPQLDGVRVIVREIPLVVWCLSVGLGKDVAKDCSECAVTLELEGHSCEKEFKTKAQCVLGAAKYVQDWYADADKNGDVVVLAPTAHCWENTDPTSSEWDPTWDPTTEKVVPDNR